MGTRAMIKKDGKELFATHWDGNPTSLGIDLLKAPKTISGIMGVAKKHSIDFASSSVKNKVNQERIKEIAKKQKLSIAEVKKGMRRGNVTSSSDYEITDIKDYGDFAEWEYDIRGDKVLVRARSGEYTRDGNHSDWKELTNGEREIPHFSKVG